MRTQRVTSILCAGAIMLLSDVGFAHGGQYRGPPDIVPPSPNGGGGHGPSGPTTGSPGQPTAPAPTGPTTPGGGHPTTGGGTGPSGRPGSPTTGARSGPIDSDLTTWDRWWEFNKDPFLRLKDAVHQGGPVTGDVEYYLGSTRRAEAVDSVKPTNSQILGDILPALKKAIDSTDQHDISSSCMVAMAKIGENHPDFQLVDVFAPRLKRGQQEVRETAALALGIAAIDGARELELLLGLALDTSVGRNATGGTVDDRTRAFAIYGLGLLAHEHTKVALKSSALAALKQVLQDDRISERNLKVAAISAISILNVGSVTSEERTVLADALQCLDDYYGRDLGPGEQLIQAHCPTAIAKLIGRDHEQSDHYRAVFAADMRNEGRRQRSSNDIARSCAIALGQLCRPVDVVDPPKSSDAKYSDQLLQAFYNHKDKQTCYFSILALGQIGGTRNRDLLLTALRKSRTLEKPWCALALGVHAFAARAAQEQAHASLDQDALIGNTLDEELKEARDPSLQAALAVALGLCRCRDAAPRMRELLLGNVAKEDLAGYLCIGLALMDDRGSIEAITQVFGQSARRVDLLKQAAVALGKLGDKRAADFLCGKLTVEGNLATLAAVSSALGFIGDRRSVEPLKRMLFDTKLGDLSRAFAAVALGGIADKAKLPWNSKFGTNINYRAAVETLTDQQSGILDIL